MVLPALYWVLAQLYFWKLFFCKLIYIKDVLFYWLEVVMKHVPNEGYTFLSH